jgi:hypothetical protein
MDGSTASYIARQSGHLAVAEHIQGKSKVPSEQHEQTHMDVPGTVWTTKDGVVKNAVENDNSDGDDDNNNDDDDDDDAASAENQPNRFRQAKNSLFITPARPLVPASNKENSPFVISSESENEEDSAAGTPRTAATTATAAVTAGKRAPQANQAPSLLELMRQRGIQTDLTASVPAPANTASHKTEPPVSKPAAPTVSLLSPCSPVVQGSLNAVLSDNDDAAESSFDSDQELVNKLNRLFSFLVSGV